MPKMRSFYTNVVHKKLKLEHSWFLYLFSVLLLGLNESLWKKRSLTRLWSCSLSLTYLDSFFSEMKMVDNGQLVRQRSIRGLDGV